MITYSFAIAVNDIPYRMMEGVGGFGGSGVRALGGEAFGDDFDVRRKKVEEEED